MNEETTIQKTINDIFKWYTTDYIGDDGFPAYFIDKEKNEKRHDLHAIADFGDYVPFFMWLGKNEFCEDQYLKTKNLFYKDKLIRSPLGYVLRKISPLKNFIKDKITFLSPSLLFSYTDFIFGLILCGEISNDSKYFSFAEDVFDFIFQTFEKSGSLIYSYNPNLPFNAKVFDTANSFYIELLVDLFLNTKKEIYLKKAETYSDFLTNSDFFKETSLFPMFIHISTINKINPIYKKGSKKVILAKNNVSAVTSFLHLFRATNNEKYKIIVYKWVKAYLNNFQTDCGDVYTVGSFPGPVKSWINLTNYSIIDVLCDSYELFKDEYFLIKAEEIASPWLKRQSESTGLIPWELNSNLSWFDSETDISIAFFKIYELTQNKKYYIAAEKVINGIIKYHKTELGFWNKVDIISGEQKGKKEVSTRYCSLFLKALIYLKDNQQMYKNYKLWSILRDR